MRRILVALGISLATPAAGETFDSAWELCAFIDDTDLSSVPCEVSGWRKAVIATLDASSDEAQNACNQFAQAAADRGLRFDGGQWRLQFKAPGSADNIIATCGLPQ